MFNMIDGYTLIKTHLFFVKYNIKMNPFTYVSNISRNSQPNVEKLNPEKASGFFKSPEIVAIIVFGGIYIFIRLVETYLTPLIPEFLTREVSALLRWGPILVPIIFGITYFSKKKKVTTFTNVTNNHGNSNIYTHDYNDSSDSVLKERMMAWTKK